MIKFILKRLGASAIVLFISSILVYFLTTISGDPVGNLRELQSDPKVAAQMAAIERNLDLDTPWPIRYLKWLGGVGQCFTGQCDLGTNIKGDEVTDILAAAASSTLRLILLSVFIAAIFGILFGVLTAVRQYSDLDYIITFVAFVLFSLPSFWAAVLLKEYAAINFNDWFADPKFSPPQIVLIAIVLGFIVQLFMGGSWKRRLLSFGIVAVVVGAALPYFTWLRMWEYPQMGPAVIGVVTLAVAVFATHVTVGIKEITVILPAVISVVLVMVVYYATWNLIEEPNWGILAVGLVLAIAVPWVLGYFMGGRYRNQAITAAVSTTLVGAFLTVVDHLFQAWPGFTDLKPRPIATIGSNTPNFQGDFWERFLDNGTQLLLPTVLLAAISMASYSRYTRSAMIEVGDQDYIRTARSKGLPERTVILRHAFRNAMIPIVTIVAMDFAAVIGGAVITEQVFGWKGMGAMFQDGLQATDPNPVMAFVLVTGGIAILFNLLTDIVYALVDPRIRV
ncbi:MAG: ABC transporter permease [Galactobacter sp.]